MPESPIQNAGVHPHEAAEPSWLISAGMTAGFEATPNSDVPSVEPGGGHPALSAAVVPVVGDNQRLSGSLDRTLARAPECRGEPLQTIEPGLIQQPLGVLVEPSSGSFITTARAHPEQANGGAVI